MKGITIGVRAILALSASTMLSGAAFAREPEPVNADLSAGKTADLPVQEIIVTARRSAESVQAVPMSITAFSQETLRQQNISTSNDLGRVVPGLTVASSQGNPSIPVFAIRGRGLNFGASAGAVETYFADVPLSMPQAAFALPPQFFDIGSFQVLKGPQGTLFGRSTTGGAIVIVPHAVDDTFNGYARAQAGNYKNIQLEGAINIPLSEGIAGLRIAGTYWKRQGYGRILPGNVDRLTGTSLDGERYNNIDQYELRATLKLTPVDGIDNTTIVTYHSDDSRGSAGAGLIRTGALGTPYVKANGYGTLWSDSDVRIQGVQARNQALGIVNTTTVEVGSELTLKNIFGIIDSKGLTSQPNNGDGSASTIVSLPASPRLIKTTQYTNEFQLQGDHFGGKFKWITGLLFDWTRQPTALDKMAIASITYASPPATCVAPSCVYINTRYGSNKVDSFGAFVSGSYEITPRLTVSGGFRRNWDSVTLRGGSVLSAVAVTPTTVAPTPALPASKLVILHGEFAGNTYNADVTYKIDHGKMLYAGYRHGYKRGGFQSSGLTQFAPEQINNIYAGIKTEWDIGAQRIRANVEFYHDNYTGQQVSYSTLNSLGSLVSLTDNIDKTRYQGVDVDLSADITKWWSISGNYAYLDAKIVKWADRTVVGSTVDLTRNPVPYVPKNKFGATSRFHFDTGFAEVALQGTVNHEDKYYTGPLCVVYPQGAQNAVNYDFNALSVGACQTKSRTTYDARIEFNNIGGTGLNIAANGVNLGNKIYWTGTSNTARSGAEGFAYAAPRMWTIEASYKF